MHIRLHNTTHPTLITPSYLNYYYYGENAPFTLPPWGMLTVLVIQWVYVPGGLSYCRAVIDSARGVEKSTPVPVPDFIDFSNVRMQVGGQPGPVGYSSLSVVWHELQFIKSARFYQDSELLDLWQRLWQKWSTMAA